MPAVCVGADDPRWFTGLQPLDGDSRDGARAHRGDSQGGSTTTPLEPEAKEQSGRPASPGMPRAKETPVSVNTKQQQK